MFRIRDSDASHIHTAGDNVILREKHDASHDGILLKLWASKTIITHRGIVEHDDIIGKQQRDLVWSSKNAVYRIHEPTLAEYVRLTPRLVTPIYPSDANLICSLLDLNVDTPSNGLSAEPPLELLEAGTGHGSLTLHLSRAIHAANPPLPRTPTYAASQEDMSEDVAYLGENLSDLQESALTLWKTSRRAIIHTLDIESKYSKHARQIVQGYRGGMYAGNVDWHVGDVSDWIASQKVLRQTEEPFLTHVLLDLPNANKHIANVARVLRVNGILTVFNPSITQIADCVQHIREQKLPYLLDQVVELGAGTIRAWDVRAVIPRATLQRTGARDLSETSSEEVDPVNGQVPRDAELAGNLAKQEKEWAMVCRPKVAQRVVGGGFLGLWRRMSPGHNDISKR